MLIIINYILSIKLSYKKGGQKGKIIHRGDCHVIIFTKTAQQTIMKSIIINNQGDPAINGAVTQQAYT